MLRTFPRLILAALLASPLFSQAQKRVYQQPLEISGNAFTKKLLTGQIIIDSASGQKLLVISNRKGMNYILLDDKWKKIKQFDGSFQKDAPTAKDGFVVIQGRRNGDEWSLVTVSGTDFSRETVNTAAGTHRLDGPVLPEFNKGYNAEVFHDGSDSYVRYMAKGSKESIALTRYDANLIATDYALTVGSGLPLRKSAKYSATDIYTMGREMNDGSVSSLYATRYKAQIYVRPDAFLIGIADDEPVAEVSWFDKGNGRKIKSDLFSLESILPESERKNSFNTSMAIYDGKVWVLTAHRNGGAIGVFDLATKALLYSLPFSDKTDPGIFAYNPCMYETSPGTVIGLSADKERVKEMSMNTFCKELYKHSVGIAVTKGADGMYRVVAGNYDLKDIATPTSGMRDGLNTMVSSRYYMMASAGLIIDAATMKATARKSSYNEMYNDAVGSKFTKVKKNAARAAAVAGEIASDTHAAMLGTNEWGENQYLMILGSDGMVKVYEF